VEQFVKRSEPVSIWVDADSVEFQHNGKTHYASGIVYHQCHHINVSDSEYEWHSSVKEAEIRNVVVSDGEKDIEATDELLESARRPMWFATYENAEEQAWDT
jgi:phosphoribosylformylglycinamidine (FGAM) synthase-like amidotransferase family enzyme